VRTLSLALLPALMLSGCARDPDNDGLTNSEERELGTGIKRADTDRDGLRDGEEVNTHGTDPLEPDTDLDGFEDGEEVEAGVDPTDPLSYPPLRWPDLSARLVEAGERGFDVGDRLGGFDGLDQNGDLVALDQFYGHVLLIQLTAGRFCTACDDQAVVLESLRDQYGDRGFWPMHVLVDDDSRDGTFEDAFAATWAERNELSYPVISDQGQAVAAGLTEEGVYNGTVPLTLLVTRDLRIEGVYLGAAGTIDAESRISGLLDAQVPGP
jgi:peroxiredoxin